MCGSGCFKMGVRLALTLCLLDVRHGLGNDLAFEAGEEPSKARLQPLETPFLRQLVGQRETPSRQMTQSPCEPISTCYRCAMLFPICAWCASSGTCRSPPSELQVQVANLVSQTERLARLAMVVEVMSLLINRCIKSVRPFLSN